MILSPNMHEIALQSDADVREFRYIFDLHYVPFGSSKNLAGFLRELRENSDFAMDIWALIRSIRLKEKGYLTHQELFTLIVIAVAGPDFSISNSHINDLLEEFDNLLASRREDVSTGRKLRQDPFPPTAFPHTPERTDHKGRSVGNQSSTGSA